MPFTVKKIDPLRSMMPKMIVHFDGQHCETVAMGSLLIPLGITLSEPMLFGLGEGLGFIYWKMKTMSFPFLGGRIKPDLLTKNIANQLNLGLNIFETRSPRRAWEGVKLLLDSEKMVGLKLDSYHLDYFNNPIHFAGHYCAIYDYDDKYAYLVDTQVQGGRVRTSLESLARARSEKGPMASNHLYYTLDRLSSHFDLEKAIGMAIRRNANTFLNPPIANLGYKGIEKAGISLLHWYEKSQAPESNFGMMAHLMENAGTGGALFRNFYRDFLLEVYQILGKAVFKEAYEQFGEIALEWNALSKLFLKLSETGDKAYINLASAKLKCLSYKEKNAMGILASV